MTHPSAEKAKYITSPASIGILQFAAPLLDAPKHHSTVNAGVTIFVAAVTAETNEIVQLIVAFVPLRAPRNVRS
jgi:hypothetical protein